MKSLCLAVAAALFCTFLTACAKTLPVDHVTGPETYEQELDIWANGFKRSYLVHVPPGYDRQKPLPLVVVIHGAFDTAAGMETYSGFSALSDRKTSWCFIPMAWACSAICSIGTPGIAAERRQRIKSMMLALSKQPLRMCAAGCGWTVNGCSSWAFQTGG